MERDNSLAAKPRCLEKLVWNSQTFALKVTVLEDCFLFLRVTNKEKKLHIFHAGPPTPGTFFTTLA